MEPRIVDYILSRCPRAPAALVDLMDALDQASLVKQRPITVKLVAEVLSASAPDASAPV
jgi:chromosomal replication initiation ATPase DnaA